MFQPRTFTKGDDNNPMLVGKEKEMYESKNWPKSFSTPVDITKVRIDAFKPWITKRVSELMGIEDDILVDYCMSQLKELGEYDAKRNSQLAGDGGSVFNEKPRLDPKRLQISLTGFMAKKASVFVRELWDLLLSAQSSEHGIPQKFIDEKKKEMEDRNSNQSHQRQRTSRMRSGSQSSSDSRHRTEHGGGHRVSRHSHKYKKEHDRTREKSREDSELRSPKRESRDRHEKSENYKNRKNRERRRRSRSRSRSSSSSYTRERSRNRHTRKRRHRSPSSSYDRHRGRRDRSSSEDSESPDRRERRRGHASRRMSRREYSSTSSSLSPGQVKVLTRKMARESST